MALRTFAGGGSLAAVLLFSSPAFAQDDVGKCLDANQSGQSLRKDKKLREARDQFKICAMSSCPTPVQRDCSRWLREVDEILPTVAFSVQDAKGKDLSDVTISMDGQSLLGQLDGTSVAVNPGRHVFVFSVAGHPDVTEEVLISEGDKARKINVRLKDGEGDKGPSSSGGARYSPYPFILGGVGAVALGSGVALFVVGKNRFPDSCRDEAALPKGADGKPTCPEGTLANSSITQSNIGIGLMIGGGVLFAGGVGWFLYESFAKPKEPTTTARPTIRPTFGLGHVGLQGTF